MLKLPSLGEIDSGVAVRIYLYTTPMDIPDECERASRLQHGEYRVGVVHGGSYLVGTPKALLRPVERHMTVQNWTEVCAGVEVNFSVLNRTNRLTKFHCASVLSQSSK